MKKNESGFGVVGILAIVITVGLTGAVGWLVWDRSKSNTNAQQTTTKEDDKPLSEAEDPKNAQQSQQKYLEIEEWAVKLPLNDGLALSYSIKDKAATIRSTELDNLSGSCTTNAIVVERGKATDRVTSTIGEGSTFLETYNNTTIDNANLDSRSIKAKIGDYYFVAPGYSGASCIDIPYEKPEGKAKQEAEDKATINIVKSINQLVAL